MAITPADIEQQTFSPSKHGYDTEEVDNFLEQISGEVDAMLQKIADLKSRLTNTEQQLAAAQAEAQSLQEQVASGAAAPAATVIAPAPVAEPQQNSMQASEHQISQVLIVAQQSADKLVEDARENAERIRNEADAKAREVIRQALAEKQSEIEEIDRLKASREDFKNEYMKLIQHFMDEAQNSFPSNLLSSTPTGSAADASPVTAPAQAAQPVAAPVATPAPAADPFAPLDGYGMDDLD